MRVGASVWQTLIFFVALSGCATAPEGRSSRIADELAERIALIGQLPDDGGERHVAQVAQGGDARCVERERYFQQRLALGKQRAAQEEKRHLSAALREAFIPAQLREINAFMRSPGARTVMNLREVRAWPTPAEREAIEAFSKTETGAMFDASIMSMTIAAGRKYREVMEPLSVKALAETDARFPHPLNTDPARRAAALVLADLLAAGVSVENLSRHGELQHQVAIASEQDRELILGLWWEESKEVRAKLAARFQNTLTCRFTTQEAIDATTQLDAKPLRTWFLENQRSNESVRAAAQSFRVSPLGSRLEPLIDSISSIFLREPADAEVLALLEELRAAEERTLARLGKAEAAAQR